MWKALFQKPIYELGIGIAGPVFGMTLIAFWRRALHIYWLWLKPSLTNSPQYACCVFSWFFYCITEKLQLEKKKKNHMRNTFEICLLFCYTHTHIYMIYIEMRSSSPKHSLHIWQWHYKTFFVCLNEEIRKSAAHICRYMYISSYSDELCFKT